MFLTCADITEITYLALKQDVKHLREQYWEMGSKYFSENKFVMERATSDVTVAIETAL